MYSCQSIFLVYYQLNVSSEMISSRHNRGINQEKLQIAVASLRNPQHVPYHSLTTTAAFSGVSISRMMSIAINRALVAMDVNSFENVLKQTLFDVIHSSSSGVFAHARACVKWVIPLMTLKYTIGEWVMCHKLFQGMLCEFLSPKIFNLFLPYSFPKFCLIWCINKKVVSKVKLAFIKNVFSPLVRCLNEANWSYYCETGRIFNT